MTDPSTPFHRRNLLRGLGGIGALSVAGLGARLTESTFTAPTMADPDDLEQDDMSGLGSGEDGRLGHHRIIWSADTDASVAALSFDDGPDPEFTPKVLEVLHSFGITATFCVMGWNALHHTDLLREVVAAGHEIGNHSWSHLDLSTTDYHTTHHEIVHGNEIIERLSGLKLQYFRPPRGELTGAALRIAAGLDLDVLLWSLTGSVPGVERPAEIRDFVLAKLAPGHIIDFHDGIGRGTFDRTSPMARGLIQRRSTEIAALPAIIETALHRGYTFVPVTKLLTRESRTI